MKSYIPENIEKGTIIRTAFSTGSGRRTRVTDETMQVINKLAQMGWVAEARNDAPRGGKTGNYVEVVDTILTADELAAEVAKAILTDKNDLYRGAMTYRLAIRNGEIVASLPEGYHGSLRTNRATMSAWAAEAARQLSELGTVVKADGSGHSFFIREQDVEAAIEAGLWIKEYDVPAYGGGIHTNFEVISHE